jgi:putative effector of murein hydrolase
LCEQQRAVDIDPFGPLRHEMGGRHRHRVTAGFRVNADAGAYAGLALGLQVLIASLLMPYLLPLLSR